MEEQKVIESAPITEEELREHLRTHINLKIFDGVHRFKSVRRAIRRGYVMPNGIVITRRVKQLYQSKYGRL